MSSSSTLIWSPTVDFVRRSIATQKQLLLVVAPFIKLDALKELLNECEDISQLQVVVRWKASDLVAGVSDVEIYPYLKEIEVPLFRHTSIHLKLLVFNQSLAFHTSGNITKKGLGLIKHGNVEIGCSVQLGRSDWTNLINLLADGEEIDATMYEQARKYAEDHRESTKTLPPMILKPAQEKEFSKDALPASESPEALFQFYSANTASGPPIEESAEFIHDIIIYSIPAELAESEFYTVLGERFRTHPFTLSLVSYIQSEGSVRFGAVNAWITEHCSDSPRPYRRDMKTTTRHLYNWLTYFYDEISWDTPNYSMVIYWNNL